MEKNWEGKILGLAMTHREKWVNLSIYSSQRNWIWVQLPPSQTKAQPPPMHWHGKNWEEKILGLTMTCREKRVNLSIYSCQRSRIWVQLLPSQTKALPLPIDWHGKHWEGKILGLTIAHREKKVNVSIYSSQRNWIWVQLPPSQTKALPPPIYLHGKHWEGKILGITMTHREKRVNLSIYSCQRSRIWVQLLPSQTKAQPPPMHWHGKNWEEKILGLTMTHREKRVNLSIYSWQRSQRGQRFNFSFLSCFQRWRNIGNSTNWLLL